ncbi:MAG: hypothetical protein Q9160_001560 [Pyrenula sp. 1 TL-2023]
MADASPESLGQTNRCTFYGRGSGERLYSADFAAIFLRPFMEGVLDRRDGNTLRSEDETIFSKWEAFVDAKAAQGRCVPEELREIKIGASIFRNTEREFLIRPLHVISEEEQVNIEARKIRLQDSALRAWLPVAKENLRELVEESSPRVSGVVVKDLVQLERRLKYNENINFDEVAKLSVLYALSSRELLDTTKPLRIIVNPKADIYWEEGGLVMPKDPPFMTRRYSDTNLVKCNLDPLINDLLQRLENKETMLLGDVALASKAQTYMDARAKHKARIPQDRTGLKMTKRGCYLVDYDAQEDKESKVFRNGPDDFVKLQASAMPLTEQIFLQEFKLRTRMPLERAKHILVGWLLVSRYVGSLEEKRALRRDWRRIRLHLQEDMLRGPRQMAIRMVMFATGYSDPQETRRDRYAQLVNLDHEDA